FPDDEQDVALGCFDALVDPVSEEALRFRHDGLDPANDRFVEFGLLARGNANVRHFENHLGFLSWLIGRRIVAGSSGDFEAGLASSGKRDHAGGSMPTNQRRAVLQTAAAMTVGAVAGCATESRAKNETRTPFTVDATYIAIAGTDTMFPVRRIYCIGRN